MVISGLFPTPVVQFKLDREFTKKEKDFLMDQPTHRNESNLTSDNYYILKEKKMADLRNFIEECLVKYSEAIYAPTEKFKLGITQSWLNYTNPSEYHHRHTHSNSMVSGVLYINASKETDKIFFYNFRNDAWNISSENYNPFNSPSWWFTVNTGDLILFPSYLPHMVERVQGDDVRVSLAFNTFPVGSVGGLITANRLTVGSVS